MPMSPLDKALLKYYIRLNDSQKKSLLEFIKVFLEGSGKSNSDRVSSPDNQELKEATEDIYESKTETVAEPEREMQAWHWKEYEDEMAKRFAEMESGKVKGYTLDELEAKARKSYKSGKKKQ